MQAYTLDLSDIEDHSSEIENIKDEKPKLVDNQPEVMSEKGRVKLAHQMRLFKEELELLNKYFQVAESAIKELREMSNQAEGDVSSNRRLDQRRRQALRAGQDAIGQLSEQIKPLQQRINLQKLQQEEEWKTKPSLYGTYTPGLRMQQDLLQQAQKRFIAVCHSFNDASLGTKAALEQKIKRIFKMVDTRGFTDEQIDKLVETEGIDKLQSMTLNSQAISQEILETAIEKHDQCVKIAQTAEEIKQMQLDFAVMLQQQTEMIDRIEVQVVMAREDLQQGIGYLQKANTIAKKSKRCLCCGICLFVIGALVVFLLVFGIIKLV